MGSAPNSLRSPPGVAHSEHSVGPRRSTHDWPGAVLATFACHGNAHSARGDSAAPSWGMVGQLGHASPTTSTTRAMHLCPLPLLAGLHAPALVCGAHKHTMEEQGARMEEQQEGAHSGERNASMLVVPLAQAGQPNGVLQVEHAPCTHQPMCCLLQDGRWPRYGLSLGGALGGRLGAGKRQACHGCE